MTAATLVLFALLRLVDPPQAEVDRLHEFAAEVVRAVDSAEELPFTGPAAREATIAALMVIAHHESGIREDIITCRVRGDQGRSITAFQLMRGFAWGGHSEAELCASNQLAATMALRVLQTHSTRCTRSGPGGWFAGYASGSCARPSRAATAMCARWVRETQRLGIVGASCWQRGELTWRPS